MNQQTLILDLDDTLIHCNKYFKQSRNEFVKWMMRWFKNLSEKEIKEKLLELDLESIKKHGLHSSRYPDSLAATYLYFCKKYKKGLRAKEIEQVRKIGEHVFEIEVEPFPEMYDVLEKLKKDGHNLYLFTGGDHKNQYRKIKQLNLQPYFKDGVFIFEHKNTKALKNVLKKINAIKNATWMIGNSLKTDIKPALDLGINAIHIPAKIEWSYNIVDIDIEPRSTFAELTSLRQLPDYLREHYFYRAI
ncbi:HAD family hydrolase [Neobacillus mesonae]|uniref:HAD family hydrolase n=1 Tax=Neobacillus mesonae TaxID=1193713 RepID=UPI00203B2574|nr:HAD family hydrolase [Neobacillus mesonae]MCM3571397.1 HAD family hydrolase [Neobacillus mesonae]